MNLLIAAASSSRPWLRPVALAYLKRIAEAGVFWASYKTSVWHDVTSSFRLSRLSSDVYVLKEVGIGDCYHLPRSFVPDLIIDGGGNNGMFSLSALKRWPHARALVFEPVPDNLDRIAAHLKANGLSAEVYPYCLGNAEGLRHFYIREPGKGSFYTESPYSSMLETKVVRLSDFLKNYPETPALIKLDIEGAEIEVMEDLMRIPRSKTYIVGELHYYKESEARFLCILDQMGWTSRFFDASEHFVNFHAASPDVRLEERYP